jgi:nucleoside-diphosphate-sugar epimerase
MMLENGSPSLSVYVTGGDSILGYEVIRQLAVRGHRVAGTSSGLDSATLIRQCGGLPVYNDLFRPGEIAGILRMVNADVIINLAPQGINSLPTQNAAYDFYIRLLSQGTAALIEAAKNTGVKFIVHTSYAFLYGDAHGEWVDETAPLASGDPLFVAGTQAERTVLQSGIPGAVLRAGYVYGPSEDFAALRDALVAGKPLLLGEDKTVANWVHAADLASAAVLAAEQQPAGEIFNIADDHPVSIAAFADHFAADLGVGHAARRRLPPGVASILVGKTHQALLAGSAKAKTEKAKSQLGWKPKFPNQQQGIEQALLTWRAHEAVTP